MLSPILCSLGMGINFLVNKFILIIYLFSESTTIRKKAKKEIAMVNTERRLAMDTHTDTHKAKQANDGM